MAEPVANLDEIRALFAHLPGPDLEAGTAAALRAGATDQAGRLARPARGAGGLARDLAGAGTRRASIIRAPWSSPAITASRRAASRPIPAAVTAQMVQNFIAGGAAVNQLCRVVDADLGSTR